MSLSEKLRLITTNNRHSAEDSIPAWRMLPS